MDDKVPEVGDGIERVIERAEIALQAFDNFKRAREAMNAARPDIDATPAERALYDERYRYGHECERAHWTHALHIIVSGDLRRLLDALTNTKDMERG